MIKEHFELAQTLGQLASTQGVKITLAESCTGGGMAHAVTSVPGSSGWFEYGFITYSNSAKSKLLRVKPQLLLQFGAVSQEVVTAMAEGAKAKAKAQYALAVSGIAGPGGATDSKPLGLVWFSLLGPDNQSACVHQVFDGSREQIRTQAVTFGLSKLCDYLQQSTV